MQGASARPAAECRASNHTDSAVHSTFRTRPLTTDFTQLGARPYFLWDEDVSVEELKSKLKSAPAHERERLAGKMLREARDIDVWHFITPSEVAEMLPRLGRRLGRRARFWQFLIEGWRADGLLA